MMDRKLRFGMIGGGRGAFIGAVHRIAARMDGQAELVAGALSSDPDRSRASAIDLLISPQRAYGTYEELVEVERRMPADERLDFVVIVTPNHRHFAPAKLLLEAGFNVVVDKPIALSLSEAIELRALARATRKIVALTHNYIGNAMVKEARALVADGALGTVRRVIVEYLQGWLATNLEQTGHRQATWRTDPNRSGPSGCLTDIGTHAEHLARYVTGLRTVELCAELTSFVPGRRLDDDGTVLLRFEGGAKGVLQASQISVGEDNCLAIRVYGTTAGLEWSQERPEELVLKYPDRPRQMWRRGQDYLSGEAKRVSRIPAGHPEGYLEAFGNVYREAFRGIIAEVRGQPIPSDLDFPTIEDGVAGLRFVEAAVASARAGASWVALPKE